MNIEKFDGNTPSEYFWNPVPVWIRWVIIFLCLPLIILFVCYIFFKGFIYWLFYDRDKSKQIMIQVMEKIDKIKFVNPSPNVLNTLFRAKSLGYKTVLYHSGNQPKKSVFKRIALDKFITKESSRFDYVIKANYSGDIIEFAKQNEVDLSQSIFIKSLQNELKDLDLEVFSSLKLLDSGR